MRIPTTTAAEWLAVDAIPEELTIRQILDLVKATAIRRWPERRLDCSLASRWPGQDPRPDVDVHHGIIEVYHWKMIVDLVTDPDKEIAIADIPEEVRANRKVGQSWHEMLFHVLLAGANLGTRPPAERRLDTTPRKN